MTKTWAAIERDEYSRTYKWRVRYSDGRTAGAANREMAKSMAYCFTDNVTLNGKPVRVSLTGTA